MTSTSSTADVYKRQSPDMTLNEVVALKEATDHSTMPVTDDGTAHG